MNVTSCTLKIRGGGVDRDCYGKRAGKGALIQWEKSGTLGVSQDQTLFVFLSKGTAPGTPIEGGGMAKQTPQCSPSTPLNNTQ